MATREQWSELKKFTRLEVVYAPNTDTYVTKIISKTNPNVYIYVGRVGAYGTSIRRHEGVYQSGGFANDTIAEIWEKGNGDADHDHDIFRGGSIFFNGMNGGIGKGAFGDDSRDELLLVRGVINTNYTHRLQKISFTASYNDLTDVPTIQSDWNQSDNTAKDYIKNKSEVDKAVFATKGLSNSISTQLTYNENGHLYVDLNLPSKTLWAKMNIGASSETDDGNYYKYGNSDDYRGLENPLSINLDMAAQVFGGGWRMPTKEQFEELLKFTDVDRSTLDNVPVFRFTSKTNVSKSIYLPCNNRYWTSTPDADFTAYALSVSNNQVSIITELRSSTNPIRPVLSPVLKNIPDSQIQADWNQSNSTALDYIKNKPSLFSGSYADLSNKPSIPAAQIQADWNQTDNTALDYIKNKPTIPSLSGTSTQIQADWSQSDNTALDYIKNKPTIPTVPASETATNGGSTLSVVTTGEKYTWNNKASVWSGTQAQYTALSPNYDSNTIYIITAS